MVGLSKSVWHYHQHHSTRNKHQAVKKDLLKIANDHPAYGYRRALSELTQGYGHPIGKNLVQKLMRSLELVVARKRSFPPPSAIKKAIRRLGDKVNLIATRLTAGHHFLVGEAVVTDFTEILYDGGNKKACLMPIIGYREKVCFGHALGATPTAAVALVAWERAKLMRRRLRVIIKGLVIHHDLGAAYTSYVWLKQTTVTDKTKASYALRGCQDNQEMESFNSRFKEENRDLFWECATFEQLEEMVDSRIHYYNYERRHSALGNTTPIKYLKKQRRKTG
jgi:putative transposase